jgi:hypothetical protein
MTSNPTRSVSVQRVIAASAAEIFAVLAAPSAHWAIDGTGSLRRAARGAPPLRAGSVFITPMNRAPRGVTRVHLVQAAVATLVGGNMRNTVVEFDEPKRIAWRNFGRHIWRYELEPVDGEQTRTLVRETFDYATNPAPWLLEWAGFPSHNAEAMQRTLERLDALVTAEAR